MIVAERPHNEPGRLAELRALDVLDTLPEQGYDDITFLASQICATPIALVSLIDDDRQWFKSRVGLETEETHRDLAFCAHAILEPEDVLVVPDAARDERFAANPLVTGDPNIRFYAGAPLMSSSGNALGTLCVIDRVPRELTEDQQTALRALSRQVMAQLDLRRLVRDLESSVRERDTYQSLLEDYQRQLEESLASATARSLTDPLTGVNNRRAFEERLAEELQRNRRSGTTLSLALIDVDHFKSYNDTLGHSAGDAALERLAATLVDTSRSTDFVARYGGEEFAVLLPNTDAEGGYILAERFRKAVECAQWPHRAMTVSIGVATSAAAIAPDELITTADEALYRAKERGRNRVVAA